MSNKKKLSDLEVLRYGIARAFLNACQQENGNYIYHHSKTRLEIDMSIVKLAMINHIDGAFTEKYGAKQGIEKAEKMYSYMLEYSALYGTETKDYKLSKLGNQMMNELFISLIEMFETDIAHKANATLH